MVLDGLPADVQPVADLRVGQSVAEQRQDLGLALGQRARRPSVRCGPGRRVTARAPRRRRRGGRPAVARRPREPTSPPRSPPPAARSVSARASSSRAVASSIGIWACAKPDKASRRQLGDRRCRRRDRRDPWRAPRTPGDSGSRVHVGDRPRAARRRVPPSMASPAARWIVDEQRPQRRRRRAESVPSVRALARGRRRRPRGCRARRARRREVAPLRCRRRALRGVVPLPRIVPAAHAGRRGGRARSSAAT